MADHDHSSDISLVVEFSLIQNLSLRRSYADTTIIVSGGLEMLFADQRKHAVSLSSKDPAGQPTTIASLIRHLCENVMRDTRKELFVLDDHLRPGILCLINDADWELEGEEEYELQTGDIILFVSTLHGG